jgi:hypothetical protein
MRILVCLSVTLVVALVVVFSKPCACYEPVVDSESVSIHTVHYGAMPFHAEGRGMIVHGGPDSQVRAQVLLSFARHLKLGQPASVKIAGIAGTLPAQVTKIGKLIGDGPIPVEVSFEQPLPPEAQGGASADVVIGYGRIENTLYMERGAFDQENADAAVFRVDPNRHATQLTVRFGVIASELIQIKSGLRQGDNVIVTDMSRWSNSNRIRLE